jgi:glutaminase
MCRAIASSRESRRREDSGGFGRKHACPDARACRPGRARRLLRATRVDTSSAGQQELQSVIEAVHDRYRTLRDGQVATYIPELSKADPDRFGVCLITHSGRTFEVGDCDHPFTIQSISKPFTFGLALELIGARAVAERVGVEPSGDTFNAITLQTGTNRPHNPMINSGAITVTALLHSRLGGDTFDAILERLSLAAGRPLTVDEAVFESERRTGHRNRAIAHLLLNFGLVHSEAEAALDVYFRQCAILVTCRDLAMMGATLANMGRNPVTGAIAYDVSSVRSMLAIMFTCGMYDYSGEWAFRVGVPAKSGVSGGVVAVVNRQLGVATFSPRLDGRGNSARGIETCAELANRFGLHAFDCLNVGSTFLDHLL